METLNGAFIVGQELQELVNKVFSDNHFHQLSNALNQELEPGTLLAYSVDQAYKFDMEIEDNFILSGKQIIFLSQDKKVQLVYRESLNVALPESEKWLVKLLRTNETDSTSYLISIFFDDEGQIQLDTISAEYSEVEIFSVAGVETLPNDPNYIPQPTDSITAQAWWTTNGCLPGGYQHCGGNCGNTGDHGGGKPINYTDSCCVLHDDCYRSGITKCKCDAMLIKCVRYETTIASMGIRLYFGPKAC